MARDLDTNPLGEFLNDSLTVKATVSRAAAGLLFAILCTKAMRAPDTISRYDLNTIFFWGSPWSVGIIFAHSLLGG